MAIFLKNGVQKPRLLIAFLLKTGLFRVFQGRFSQKRPTSKTKSLQLTDKQSIRSTHFCATIFSPSFLA
jgi:hypothetical protein